MIKKMLWLATALCLVAQAAATTAQAQTYPNRPVKVIVPTPAGGPVDVVARLVANQITPVLGQRKREHGSGLGKFRWYVERTIAWLHSFGRLRRRLDRLREIQEAFLRLGCSLVCLRFLSP